MTDETANPSPIGTEATDRTVPRGAGGGFFGRLFWGMVKWGWGALLMQGPAGAILVAGWLQRFLQRSVYVAWWKRCRGRVGRFEEFVAEEPLLEEFRHAPNWVLGPNFGSHWASGPREGRWRRRWRLLVGSLGRNLGWGLQSLSNVWVLTLPGCVLWAAGWWGGWQNSFHKGYEHFAVGPTVSWLGILVFVVAMFYVPMATARQASTGRWQAFWEARTIWTLTKASWLPSTWVAVLYAGANVVAMGLKSWPQFLPQARMAALARQGAEPTGAFRPGVEGVDWSALTEAQALPLLNQHFLVSALVVFAILVMLKRAVAWLYSGAVLRAVQTGALGEEQLADGEWRLLHTLGALEVRERPRRAFVIRSVAWAGTKVGRAACGSVSFLAWLIFVGAIYVSEFLAYHPLVGWLNQPLVQLPWFRYVPATLEDPSGGLLAAAGLVILTAAVASHRNRPRSQGPGPRPASD